MTDEEYEKLISHKFFKPEQLILNSDKLQKNTTTMQVMAKEMRRVVFQTAQLYKDDLKNIEKDQSESLCQDILPNNNLIKLLLKIYTLGLQNGAVGYANSLIKAIEAADEFPRI